MNALSMPPISSSPGMRAETTDTFQVADNQHPLTLRIDGNYDADGDADLVEGAVTSGTLIDGDDDADGAIDEDQEREKPMSSCSLLLRFFKSDIFNVHHAMTYLFKKRELGIQRFLAQRLHSFPSEDVDFYLPQLVSLLLRYPSSSRYLSAYFSHRVNASLKFATELSWLLFTINQGSEAIEKPPSAANTTRPLTASQSEILLSTTLAGRRGLSEPHLNESTSDDLENGMEIDKASGSPSGSIDYLAANSPSSSAKLKSVASVDKVFPSSGLSNNDIGDTNPITEDRYLPSNASSVGMSFLSGGPSLSGAMDSLGNALPPSQPVNRIIHLYKHKRTASDLTNVFSWEARQSASLEISKASPANEESDPGDKKGAGQSRFVVAASKSACSRYWMSVQCGGSGRGSVMSTRSDTHLLKTTAREAKVHRPPLSFTIDLLGFSPADIGQPLADLQSHLSGFLDAVPSHLCTPVSELCFRQWDFILALLSISRRLTSFTCKEQRTGHLQAELAKVNLSLPARVWLPVERAEHIVLRIPPNAAVCLNSACKAPYLIFVEIMTCDDVATTPLPKRTGTYSSRPNQRLHDFTVRWNQSVSLPRPSSKLSIGGAKAIAAPDVISLFSTDSGSGSSEEVMPHCYSLNASGSASPHSVTPEDNDADDDNDVDSGPETATPVATPVGRGLKGSLCSPRKQGIVRIGDNAIYIKAVEVRRRLLENASCKPATSFKLDPQDPSAAVLKEPFELKARRIRESSPWGHLPGWRLSACIIKVCDDLRQEQLAYQLLTVLQRIWSENRLELWLRPLNIIVTSPDSGLIELVTDTVSLHQIRRHAKLSLRDYIIREHGPPNSEGFLTAQRNFVQSCAAYCTIGYLLQVKDRHNGNILIDRDGHVIHIDYGFMLSTSPGKNLGFETSPFKLTAEQVELMGGVDSDMFRYYKNLILSGLVACKKHMDEICLLVEIASVGYPHLACFSRSGGLRTVEALRKRFLMSSTEAHMQSFVDSIVEMSLNSLTTRLYDSYQYYTNGIQ